MSKLSKLLQVTEEEKIAILKQLGTNETEIHRNVHLLKQWISQCSHLPNEDDERKLRNILFNCKMNIERAKQAIEGYLRVRTMYSNEMFDRLIPNSKEYMLAKKYVRTVVMPKLTPDLCRVTIYKMFDPSGEAYSAFLYEMLVLMMAEIRLATDFYLSNTIVIDFESYGWKNLIKFTPSLNQMLADVLISTHLRIHAIHFINMPNFIDQIMMLVKTFIPSKVVEKIHIHKSHEGLLKHIPREYLPSDYGGNETSIEDLYEEWCGQVEESEEFFKKLLTLKSTQKYEFDPSQKELFGIGTDGSFRKLTVD